MPPTRVRCPWTHSLVTSVTGEGVCVGSTRSMIKPILIPSWREYTGSSWLAVDKHSRPIAPDSPRHRRGGAP